MLYKSIHNPRLFCSVVVYYPYNIGRRHLYRKEDTMQLLRKHIQNGSRNTGNGEQQSRKKEIPITCINGHRNECREKSIPSL